MEIKDIKTKDDIRLWLKQQKEKEFDFLTNGIFMIDDIIPQFTRR